ncbi:MAG: GGDEF domain-containing protein [Gammaproteobacteria bacterium]|nr:diguanylate cyclase [Gammaproteobacteria bacterium]
MKKPGIPEDEQARLLLLDALGSIYSPAEERFDRITRLACQVLNVPIALVSLITARCQWFKSAQGLAASETSREISFCGHTILGADSFVVPDTLLDPDFADNPLVSGEPHIRFYAGHPLRYEGSNVGTLCIIGRVPRRLTPSESETLRNLAEWAENELKVAALSEAQAQLISVLDEARRAALIDSPTRSWNRQAMDELLPVEVEHCRVRNVPISVVMVEVGNLKTITGRYGPGVTDWALREVAQRIRSSIRPQDLIGRFADDQFLIFLGNCTEDTVMLTANRILSRVCGEPVTADGVSLDLALAIGASTMALSPEADLSRLFQLTGAALSEAQAAGRNCVRLRTSL